MSTQLKLRRGTTAQHSTFTGAEGEITVDTTKKTVVVHDGFTAGGSPLTTESSLANTLDAYVLSDNALAYYAPQAAPTFSGNVTLSSGTANGVAYLNGSKVLTTGSALTFDGTNLGVGTSPSDSATFGRAVDVRGTTGGAYYAATTDNTTRVLFGAYSGAGYLGTETNHPLVFRINGSEQMRLTSTGLGIGTSSPGQKLTVAGAIQTTSNSSNFASNSGAQIDFYAGAMRLAPYLSTGSDIQFYTNPNGGSHSERMRIDSSGNLLVGTTSGGYKFTVLGASAIAGFQITNTGSIVDFYANTSTYVGSISTNGSTTSYNTSSDYRLKENIQPMQNALAVVQQLNPVTYTWKADGSDGQGFIAHELQAVVPDCVTGEKDAVDAEGKPVYQGIDTSFLVATLTKAIQEQQEQINQLTARVAQLEGN